MYKCTKEKVMYEGQMYEVRRIYEGIEGRKNNRT